MKYKIHNSDLFDNSRDNESGENIKKNLPYNTKPKTFFDFCSGVGSAHLAFKRLKLKCLGYSEIDEKAEKLYKLFYGNSYKNYGDLMKINPQDLADFDILVAGFPCQAFSIAGKRKGFEDDRGQVIYGLKKIISYKKPKAFLLENVKGLINLNNGMVLQEIVSLLRGCGYNVYYKLIESTDFGIPQIRQRIYFVGIRSDLSRGEFLFPDIKNNQRNLSEFLIDENSELVLDQKAMKTFQKYLENKYNFNKFNLDQLLNEDWLVIDTRQSDLRLYRNKIPTLRTGRQGIIYVKDQQLRKLSAMEAFLLQGFDYEMSKIAQDNFAQTRLLAQIGNAMTVDVMEHIGCKIIDYLS